MSGYTKTEVDKDTILEGVRLGLMREAPDEPGTYEFTKAGLKWFTEWLAEQTKEAPNDV
jgi:hypothetical protein